MTTTTTRPTTTTRSPVAGWYADPAGPGRDRWWDGSGWTDRTCAVATGAARPAHAATPASAPALPVAPTTLLPGVTRRQAPRLRAVPAAPSYVRAGAPAPVFGPPTGRARGAAATPTQGTAAPLAGTRFAGDPAPVAERPRSRAGAVLLGLAAVVLAVGAGVSVRYDDAWSALL